MCVTVHALDGALKNSQHKSFTWPKTGSPINLAVTGMRSNGVFLLKWDTTLHYNIQRYN
jgi:hypothetical protein